MTSHKTHKCWKQIRVYKDSWVLCFMSMSLKSIKCFYVKIFGRPSWTGSTTGIESFWIQSQILYCVCVCVCV